MEQGSSHPILLYDGVCGLCNRGVQFVLRRDPAGAFRFASLQSAFARQLLSRHSVSPSDLDTFYVVVGLDPGGGVQGERLLGRSDAVIFVLDQLGGLWRCAAWLLRITPAVLRDGVYNFVARRRYRMFGKYDRCPVPTEETRARFLDL